MEFLPLIVLVIVIWLFLKNRRSRSENVQASPSLTQPGKKTISRVLMFVLAAVVILLLTLGVSNRSDQLAANEAEQKRVASLTPEQLAAEADAKKQAASVPKWKPLSAHMMTGVKVYTGDNKVLGFEILGGNSNCKLMEGSGVKVRYPNGTEEWKSRSALRNKDIYFVRDDDPALQKNEWYEIQGC
jgi:hypothetical protein